jgi:membrane protein
LPINIAKKDLKKIKGLREKESMEFLKRLMIKKPNVSDSAEKIQAKWYSFFRILIDRLIKGLYIFINNKGEVHASSATFFTILSFAPIILMIISLYAWIIGNTGVAYNEVMSGIQKSFPELAPWIYKSIQKIVKAQMNANSHNILNTILLIYSGLGLSNTMVFGTTIVAGEKLRGGFILENLKAVFATLIISSFIIGSIILSFESKEVLVNIFGRGDLFKMVHLMFTNGIIQAILFVIIFSLFYMYITPVKIRIVDGVLGSLSVAVLFFIFKYFYKFYVAYNKESLIQTFGNFYTIIVAVLFIYFIYCSFYFGAAVAYAPAQLVREKKKTPLQPSYLP